MCANEPDIIQEWLTKAYEDEQAAHILLHNDGPLSTVGFHLQQAFEKYLKAYLVYASRKVRRIHDLESLLGEIVEIEPEFSHFQDAAQRITEYYIESRYPLGLPVDYDRGELEQDLAFVHSLRELIQRKTGQSGDIQS